MCCPSPAAGAGAVRRDRGRWRRTARRLAAGRADAALVPLVRPGARPGRPRTAPRREALEDAAATLQGHLDRSNFTVEMHQAFLDLVVAGTGLLLVEEAPLGEASALRFTAVPVRDRGAGGRPGWPALHHLPPGAADRGAAAGPLPRAPRCPPRWPRDGGRPDAAPGAGSGLAGARHHPLRRDPAPIPAARCCWPRAASPKARPSPSAG